MERRSYPFLRKGIVWAAIGALPLVSAGQQVPRLIKPQASYTETIRDTPLRERNVMSSVRRKTARRAWTVQRIQPPAPTAKPSVMERSIEPLPVAEVHMVFATVHKQGSFLYWHFNGQRFEAWSELDFSMLEGVVEYRKNNIKHTTFILAQLASDEFMVDQAEYDSRDGLTLSDNAMQEPEAADVVLDLLALYASNTEHFSREKVMPEQTIKVKPSDIVVNC